MIPRRFQTAAEFNLFIQKEDGKGILKEKKEDIFSKYAIIQIYKAEESPTQFTHIISSLATLHPREQMQIKIYHNSHRFSPRSNIINSITF